MIKKGYIISILIVCLLVCSPVLNASKIFNSNNLEKSKENYTNEEIQEMKDEILERYYELRNSHRSFLTLEIFNKTDPDGPLEGGMDDISDLICFYFGYIELKAAIRSAETLITSPSLLNLIITLEYTWAMTVYFGEAFDTREFFEDGR
jgi:hypothetical protein